VSATIVPATVLEALRREREERRRQKEALQGSILVQFDEEDDHPSSPASPAPTPSKETRQ
jgi:hypothetical protein